MKVEAEQETPNPLPSGDYTIVEMMGHSTLVGRYAEVECFGTKMMALEPVFRDLLLPEIRIGGASIYRMTPCSREVAWERRPKRAYEIPPSLLATVPPAGLPAPQTAIDPLDAEEVVDPLSEQDDHLEGVQDDEY